MKKKTIFSLIVGLVFVLLVASRMIYPLSVLEKVSSVFVYPFIQTYRYTIKPIQVAIAHRRSKKELQQLLAQCEKQLSELLSENIVLKMAIDFEQETNELRQFKNRYKTDELLCSQIIARTHHELQHEWVIDCGSRHGVNADMVAVFKNCLLGKVTAVYPWYSKVTLLTDKSSNIAAYCLKTKTTGIIQGGNSTQPQLAHVSHLAKVVQNDLVVSAGKGLVFPKGFALGRVDKIHKGNLCYEISVKPMVDFDAIEYCYLMKKS